jgi:hypothetical protein
MRVGSATWRSIVNYRLATQAQQKFGSAADAVIMLNYVESPRHAAGTGMAISFSPGPGMVSKASASQSKSSVTKPAPVVDDGLRTVVLYRENQVVNSGASYRIIWEGKSLGFLRNGSVLRVRLPPGNQKLGVSFISTKPPFEQSVVVAEDSETYVLFRMKFSFSDDPSTHMTITPVSPSVGRAAVGRLGM